MVLANTYKTAHVQTGKNIAFLIRNETTLRNVMRVQKLFVLLAGRFAERERRNKTTAATIKKHKKCRGNFYFCQTKPFIGFSYSFSVSHKMSLTLEIKRIPFNVVHEMIA